MIESIVAKGPCFLLTLMLAHAVAAQGEGVVPRSAARRFGLSYSDDPFGRSKLRYQQVFHGDEMPTDFRIVGLGLRQDETESGRIGYDLDLEIKLGYTTRGANDLGTSFASNFDLGAPTVVVRRKPFVLPDMPPTRPKTPREFFLEIPFDQAFAWQRRPKRNLLIEITVYGNNVKRGFKYTLDADAYTTTSTLVARGTSSASSGTLLKNFGVVMRFESGVSTTFGDGCHGTGGIVDTVVPALYKWRMGERESYYGTPDMRCQQVLEGQEIGTGVINAMALRQDDGMSAAPSGFSKLKINVGWTKRSASTITSKFDSNFDVGKPVTVFDGTVDVSRVRGVNLDPSVWRIVVPFAKPVSAPPSGLNLLIEVVNTTSAYRYVFMDAAWKGGKPLPTSIVWAQPATAKQGTVTRNYGLVVGLDISGRPGYSKPGLSHAGSAIVGRTFALNLSQARPGAPALQLTGWSNQRWGNTALPLDLRPLGAPGCKLLVSPDLMRAGVVGASGRMSVPIVLPRDSRLGGVELFSQFLVLDAGANALGLAVSNGGREVIGLW